MTNISDNNRFYEDKEYDFWNPKAIYFNIKDVVVLVSIVLFVLLAVKIGMVG